MSNISLLDVSFESSTPKEYREKIEKKLNEQQSLRIVTVNPEFLVEAEKNVAFKKIIQEADIRLVDGIGIVLMAWLKGQRLYRYTGVQLVKDVLQIADEKGITVYLSLKQNGLSNFSFLREKLLKSYPQLQIENYAERRPSHYAIILCNYGAPEQEFFLETTNENACKVGVGGALDFLCGKQKRAPYFMQSLGLEWLWRLLLQPSRLKRIWNAVAVFPYYVLLSTIRK